MKKLLFISGALLVLFMASCNLFNKDDENDIGGSTDVPFAQVGNKIDPGSVNIDGNYVDVDASIEVINNKDGIATMQVIADLKNQPELKWIDDLIPGQYKDAQGRLNTTTKFKITSEGIQDHMNLDEKPHTMVKYDCKVGDTYKVTKSNGVTITRTVTEKTNQDDFPYGFMYIKTIEVEQDSRIPGIDKIVYRFNHKFGLVWAEAYAEDGSKLGLYFYTDNY